MPLRPALGGALSALVLAGPASAAFPEAPGDSWRPRAAERPRAAAERPRFVVPLDGPLHSRFGYRWGRLHSGIDIAVLGSDRVRAALPGVVVSTGYLPRYSGYGLVVRIHHDGAMETMYAHLAAVNVRQGDAVDAGEAIARAGCSGSCTGPHLHFEVHVRGKPVDPLRFLERRGAPATPGGEGG